MEGLAIKRLENAERDFAQPHRLFEHRVEHRREVAGRGVDDLQDLGRRGLSGQRLVSLSVGRGKIALKIGNDLPGINERAVRLRAHLWTWRDRLSGRIIP
jgi:hypothetical protein